MCIMITVLIFKQLLAYTSREENHGSLFRLFFEQHENNIFSKNEKRTFLHIGHQDLLQLNFLLKDKNYNKSILHKSKNITI